MKVTASIRDYIGNVSDDVFADTGKINWVFTSMLRPPLIKITEHLEEVFTEDFKMSWLGDKLSIFTIKSDIDVLFLLLLQSLFDNIDMLLVLQHSDWHPDYPN